MIFPWAILIVAFLAGVWIAADLLRPGGRPRLLGSRREGKPPSNDRGPLSYAPVVRLLDDQDLRFLDQRPELRGRFQDLRRSAARRYLGDLRRDYLEVWDVCRILAPIAPDPNFVSQLTRQYWNFHWMYVTAHFHCVLRPSGSGRFAGERLISALDQLRLQAGELLAVSDSALAAPMPA